MKKNIVRALCVAVVFFAMIIGLPGCGSPSWDAWDGGSSGGYHGVWGSGFRSDFYMHHYGYYGHNQEAGYQRPGRHW